MNYLRHYLNLVRKAENRISLTGYTEKHHIFPISVFGPNKRIVKLSAREHYIAHALLEKIFIKRYGINSTKTKKMIHAFFMMNNVKGVGQHRYFNSRLFEASKIKFSKMSTGENSRFYGKKRIFSEEHITNLNASRKKGKDHPNYGKPRSNETLKKMCKPKHEGHGKKVSESRKGIKFSEEHINNLRISHLGQSAWNKGIPWSEEARKKMSESQSKRDKSYITEEYKNKQSENMKRVWSERKTKRIGEN